MIEQVRAIIYRLKRFVAERLASVNERPLLVVGNQKSGTTVIAALLAEYAGYTSLLDFDYDAAVQLVNVQKEKMTFDDFVESHTLEFSRDLVKEPHLTFLLSKLHRRFPEAQYLMIVRDPRSNIRSILNRVNIRGDQLEINVSDLQGLHLVWRYILTNEGLGLNGENYIERLAYRWNHAVDQYREHHESVRLVRYEDFLASKATTIETVAHSFGLPKRNEIANKVDIQYQPKGNREVSWKQFFGQKNLEAIESICGSRMKHLGYSPKMRH